MVSNNLIDWHNDPHTQFVALEQQLGLKVGETARALGVPYDTYKNWKSGRTNISPSTFRSIELLLMYPKTAKKLAKKW